ncbi:MAG: helix-turn-helix domain-containing protein [Bacteroidota bacterium]
MIYRHATKGFTAYKFFALLFFSFSLTLSLVALKESSFGQTYPIIQVLPLYLLLIGPFALHYGIHYLIEPKYKFRRTDYLGLLPFISEFLFQVWMLLLFLADKKKFKAQNEFINQVFDWIEGLSALGFIVVAAIGMFKLGKHQEQLLKRYANLESRSFSWLQRILQIFLLLGFVWLIVFLISPNDLSYYYPLFLLETLLVYYIAYSLFVKKDLLDLKEEVENEKSEVKNSPELSKNTETYYEELVQLVEHKKLYHDQELSLGLLARKMDLSAGYLSQIINEHAQKNFFDFINAFRVEEVKQNLNDPAFDHFSILGLAYESGFKSKSTFNSVFKKMTGQTPSQYKKSLKKVV